MSNELDNPPQQVKTPEHVKPPYENCGKWYVLTPDTSQGLKQDVQKELGRAAVPKEVIAFDHTSGLNRRQVNRAFIITRRDIVEDESNWGLLTTTHQTSHRVEKLFPVVATYANADMPSESGKGIVPSELLILSKLEGATDEQYELARALLLAKTNELLQLFDKPPLTSHSKISGKI